MRFYIIDDKKHKIHVEFENKIKRREDLDYYYSIVSERCCETVTFSRNDVVAEPSNGFSGYLALTFTCGFVMGMLSQSIIGILLGFFIGIILGIFINLSDIDDVKRFNNSEG